MKTISEKRKAMGLSQEKLAKRVGVSRSTIAMWETGGSRPGPDELLALSKILQISVDELLDNDMGRIEDLHSSNKGVRVPVLGVIPAGIPIEAIEDVLDYEEIPADWTAGGKEYFALRISGNSMYPKYLEGDVVIFLQVEDCENGMECAVIVNGQDATFKKIIKQSGGLVLQPLNTTDHEPAFYSNEEVNSLPLRIIGIAKEIRRKA